MFKRRRLAPVTAAPLMFLYAAAPRVAAQAQEFTPAEMRPTSTSVPESPVVAPMKFRGPLPAVDVMVNGKGPFTFAIDTAASGTVAVDTGLVEKLGLPVVDQIQGTDGSQRTIMTFDLVEIDSIAIAGATFTGLRGSAHEFNALGGAMLSHIDGIVGIALFSECLITLDYKNERVRIERGELPAPNGQTVLALDKEKPIPAIPIQIADATALAHIDSGSMGSIRVPHALAKTLPLGPPSVTKGRTITGEIDVHEARLDGAIRFGQHEIANPIVSYYEGFDTANFGSSMLRQFASTFDWKNRRVRFERETPGPIQIGPRYRVGVMFRPDGETFVVDGTVPDGAAAKAGLTKGDRVLTINGKAPGAYKDNELPTVFGSPQPIELRVHRGEAQLTITVTPEAVE